MGLNQCLCHEGKKTNKREEITTLFLPIVYIINQVHLENKLLWSHGISDEKAGVFMGKFSLTTKRLNP